jgi:hypothetical protein
VNNGIFDNHFPGEIAVGYHKMYFIEELNEIDRNKNREF